jgi:Amt family ammonium transporter
MAVIEGTDLDALNYVVKVPYNGTGAAGGNPITDDLNIWYEVSYLNFPMCSSAT